MSARQPEHPGSLASTVLHGARLAAAGYVFTQLLMFAALVGLARFATPKDFGVLAAGSVVVGIGSLVAESGMRAALIHRAERVEEAANTALLATLAAGLGLTMAGVALSPLIGRFFGGGDVAGVAAAMSALLLLRAATVVPDALMQRRFSFLRRIVVEPAGAVAFGVTGIIACSSGLGAWGLVLAFYASAAVHLVATWALAGWRPRPGTASFAMWRDLARYGRHVAGSEFIRRIGEELDVLVVGRFLGTGPLGLFRYGFKVAVQPLAALVNGASYAVFPALARIATDERRFREAALRALRSMCLLAFPLSLLLLPLGEPGVVLVFGERWRVAGQVVACLCVYSAAHAVVSIASEAVKAAGAPQFLTRMHALAVALAACLMLALVPFGILGVAIGLSASALGVGAYAIRVIAVVSGAPWRRVAEQAWPPLVAAVGMAAALFAVRRWAVDPLGVEWVAGIGLLTVHVIVGAGLYLGLLAAVSRPMAREVIALGASALRRLRPGRTGSRQMVAS